MKFDYCICVDKAAELTTEKASQRQDIVVVGKYILFSFMLEWWHMDGNF